MPWSDVPDPIRPMSKAQKIAAIIHRLAIAIFALIIIGIIVAGWVPTSAVAN